MKQEDLWNIGELVGRVLLGLLFVLEAFSKLGEYGAAGRYMAAFGIPALLLPGGILVEFGAGAMVIAGWRTRWAAAVLAAFCVFVAVVFHTKFSDRDQLIHFEKDLALAGAFLVVAALGAGRLSIDAWLTRHNAKGAPASHPSIDGGCVV